MMKEPVSLKGNSSQHVLRSVATTCLFAINTKVINRYECMNSGWNLLGQCLIVHPCVRKLTAATLTVFVSQSHLHVSV